MWACVVCVGHVWMRRWRALLAAEPVGGGRGPGAVVVGGGESRGAVVVGGGESRGAGRVCVGAWVEWGRGGGRGAGWGVLSTLTPSMADRLTGLLYD